MRSSIVRTLQLALIVLLTLALVACGSSKGSSGTDSSGAIEQPTDSVAENKTCLACHASQAALDTKLVIDRDSLIDRDRLSELRDTASAIEWGELEEDAMSEAEHAELGTLAAAAAVEDRANGLLVEAEVMGTHGKLACVECHTNSDETMNDWHPAITSNPTADGGDVCASCHGTKLVENFKASIHFTLSGIANGACKRLKPLTDIDPDAAQAAFDGYFTSPDTGCMACHATCGSCHVSSPLIQDVDPGGLMENHRFVSEPESELTCMKCHWENGEGWEAMDVHATNIGMECTNCHTAIEEVHGRDIEDMTIGPLYYKGPTTTETGPVEASLTTVLQTSCADCHETPHAGVTGGAVLDLNHMDSLDCFACHTQPYYNCVGCHAVSGEPEDMIEYVKLGLTVKGEPTSKLGLLTHIGTATAIEGYAIPADNSDPQWKSAWAASSAMHLIDRKPLINETAKISGSMCDNCHSVEGADTFLKATDLDAGGTDPVDDLNWVVPVDRLPEVH
ncbi:MAG: hypothetical protein BA874_00245 [Desulfuromonadales bacterium C00003068]|jgi:hypothetical protein|nr:MAG: hypothetical protein BA874_00245 [Desulfuromonadales bacterium C00003068]